MDWFLPAECEIINVKSVDEIKVCEHAQRGLTILDDIKDVNDLKTVSEFTFSMSLSFKLKSSNWNEWSWSVAALGTFCLKSKKENK